MRERIISLLERIDFDLGSKQGNSSSLMSGSTGSNLYQYLYYKHCNPKKYNEVFVDYLNLLIEDSQKIPHSTFGGGKSGTNWFFSFLYKQGVMSKRDWKLLTSDDNLLSESALKYIQNDNYDFLHGGLGIAHYLKYIKNKGNKKFFDDFFVLLNNVYQKGNTMLPLYDTHTGALDINNINVGFAHGIIGVLKFCIDCFKDKICIFQAHDLSQRIITFMKANVHDNTTMSYFPCYLGYNFPTPVPSRLGWCYGDLIIAYTLLEAATVFNDAHLRKFALEVLHHSNSRRDFNSTSVDNVAICHGSSGIAHIYNKLWHKTGDASFQETRDFWIKKTIDFYYKEKDAQDVFFSKYNYQAHQALLTGEAGVGLVLLTYLTEDFSWDYCLMLN